VNQERGEQKCSPLFVFQSPIPFFLSSLLPSKFTLFSFLSPAQSSLLSLSHPFAIRHDLFLISGNGLPPTFQKSDKCRLLGGRARPGGKAVVLGMMRHRFFHRSGRKRPWGSQIPLPVPPPSEEGKRSFIGSLPPADPAFKPRPCPRATRKGISKPGGRAGNGA
jgi:hypothetical protein